MLPVIDEGVDSMTVRFVLAVCLFKTNTRSSNIAVMRRTNTTPHREDRHANPHREEEKIAMWMASQGDGMMSSHLISTNQNLSNICRGVNNQF